jgi:uncharacterized membrane protein YjdF
MTLVLWALRAWLAFLAGYSLAVTPTYTSTFLLVSSALTGLAASIGFALVPTQRPRTLQTAEAIVLASFILHVMGHAFGFYAHVPHYDKMLHVVVPAGAVYALYALSQSTRWIWRWTKVRPVEVAIYLFCILVTLGAVWELFEFGTDSLFGTHEQDDNSDTMLDLVADFVGALVGAVLVGLLTAYGRRNGFESIAESRQALMRRIGPHAWTRTINGPRRRSPGKPE